MIQCIVVADRHERPSEGMHVVSGSVVAGLREHGIQVVVLSPRPLLRMLLKVMLARPKALVFTHGPGPGVVFVSILVRLMAKTKVVWLATRPELGRVPKVFRGRKSAHVVIGNRFPAGLEVVAPAASFIQVFIGVDPSRLAASQRTAKSIDARRKRRPVALHVGHLRPNRGLHLLVALKQELGEEADVVIHASPTFPPDERLVEELERGGVLVRRGYVENIGDAYRACDVYVFPCTDEDGGAIELPLSVLEAVACRRPVVSTTFGALSAALSSTPGVVITESPHAFVQEAAALLRARPARRRSPEGLPDHLHISNVCDVVARTVERLCDGS